jgi:hypothetical protein
MICSLTVGCCSELTVDSWLLVVVLASDCEKSKLLAELLTDCSEPKRSSCVGNVVQILNLDWFGRQWRHFWWIECRSGGRGRSIIVFIADGASVAVIVVLS